MEFKTIGKSEAQSLHETWQKNPTAFRVDEHFSDLRDELTCAFDLIAKPVSAAGGYDVEQDKYVLDLEFGLKLYSILDSSHGFTLRHAADDGIWRHLAVAVIPDIIATRWGGGNADHYWKKPSRNWLRQIWWYIHLSWAGSIEETREILRSNSTDEILNLVERPGQGYNVPLFRNLMYQYSKVPQQVRQRLRKGKGKTLFRSIMVMNNAYTQTVDPGLFDKKEEGYVRWLFDSTGVTMEE